MGEQATIRLNKVTSPDGGFRTSELVEEHTHTHTRTRTRTQIQPY